ncbi:MAG: anthranilate synthase component I family protein [Deltaproteobacteria bacterium]|jgi:anthranilate synthase component 1|nr:anthranilate synthase component I family protein [Deltaproteobacteria bacterium]
MITLSQKGRSLASDLDTPISLFLEKIGGGSGVLLESAEVGGRWGRYSLIGAGVLLKLSCSEGFLKVDCGKGALEPLKRHEGLPFLLGLKKARESLQILSDPAFPGLPPITRALYGYLGYGLVSLIEPKLMNLVPPNEAEAALILPREVYLFDHVYRRLVSLALPGEEAESAAPPPPAPFDAGGGPRVSPSREAHRELCGEAKELIASGELIQLVLSVGFDEPFQGDPFSLYRALRRLNPSPYMFHLQLPDFALTASSPEVLASADGRDLKLRPIAGTRPRGQSPEEDNLFEVELSSDLKEQAEHVMLVDLGRNDLGKISDPGTVKVERYMDIERFSHVMHLTSQISSTLKEGLDGVDVLSAVFPAGTVAGAPKFRAMELIARMEGEPRGPYAGGLGWLGLDRGGVFMDFGITIRAAWIRGGRVYYRAGSGLVYDSEAESEWRECLNKARAIKEALEGLKNPQAPI